MYTRLDREDRREGNHTKTPEKTDQMGRREVRTERERGRGIQRANKAAAVRERERETKTTHNIQEKNSARQKKRGREKRNQNNKYTHTQAHIRIRTRMDEEKSIDTANMSRVRALCISKDEVMVMVVEGRRMEA